MSPSHFWCLDQIKEVQKALGLRAAYHEAVKNNFKTLVKKKMTAPDTEKFLSEVIFPMPKRVVQTVGEGGIVHSLEEATSRAKTTRLNNIKNVMELVEDGAGADIKGVKGTAYGAWMALTEWRDHEATVKVMKGRDEAEVKFANAFFGTGAKFKADSYNELMKFAA